MLRRVHEQVCAEKLSSGMRLTKTAESVQVPTKFTLHSASLPDLKLFSTEHLDAASATEAAELIMLLRLTREMLLQGNPVYGILQASQNGYILHNSESFLERLDSSLDELAEFVHQVVPEAPLPRNAEDLLGDFEAMTGSSWPIIHGPVIRRAAGSVMIDFFSAWMRLEHALSFNKNVSDPLPKQRSKHFEDQVQRIIDDSQWGNVPEKLRDLRRRKHLKRADGEPLTDIDAIGVLGNTVLIVECKSWIETDDLFLGTHSFARDNAERLEREVRKCRKYEDYLRKHPGHRTGSYDFSAFKRLVVVLCTTAPVYVELGMVQNTRLKATELLSTQEVLPGLLAAVSVSELAEWLNSPYASSYAPAK